MISTGKPKINFDGLKELFWEAHKAFLKNHRELLDGKLSERCLCGALMYELNKQLEIKGYNNYYADVEFNKIGKKGKCIKQLLDNEGALKHIFTDIIVHSRGQASPDNLIALEMKKSGAKNLSKENDRERLKQLTKQDVVFNNCCIYRYELGIYYEIDLKNEEILVEFYQDGSKVEEKVSKF